MKKKVLVVDNHPLILKLMANLLEKEGAEVLTAGDGLAALEILESHLPDLIFIDLVMPNIPGDKLCRIIRALPDFKKTRIVILSAVAVEDEIDFTSFGADACIAKGPFKEVARHVVELLDSERFAADQRVRARSVIGKGELYEREATKELLASSRHYEGILNGISEGVLELTGEGRVIYANRQAMELLGVVEERLLASTLFDFFQTGDRQRIEQLLNDDSGLLPKIDAVNPVSRDGRDFALRFMPLADRSRRSRVAVLSDVTQRRQMDRDLERYQRHLEELVREKTGKLLERTKELQEEITAHRRAEQERQKLQLQLQQSQKMQAIGTLAGGIAHDFNNILSAILGYAELLQAKSEKGGQSYNYLAKIIKSVGRAADLVRQILTFSRQTGVEKKPMLLQPVVKEALKLLRGGLPSSIRLDQQIDADCPVVQANLSQIHQVIMNLCTNAYQAMRGKQEGRLTVILGMAEPPESVRARWPGLEQGRYVRLRVRDNGEGIAPEHLDRIFEPYFTTRQHNDGSGLGLAAVHGIVSEHGGAISVASSPGEGTEVDVYLPVLQKQEEGSGEPGLEPMSDRPRVLFVDDEEMIVDMAASVLKRLNCQVEALGDSREAMARFEEEPDGFDVVITDQTMPGLVGTELARRMLALRPDLPIILCTGFSETVDEAGALAMGIKGFLMKPLSISELSNMLRRVLDK